MHAARGETGYVPGEMLCHYVTRPYDKCAEDDGYLVLKEGQVVFVEYIGCDGHEEGWLFGYKSGSENHHGWFPQWCIEKIPPVPPTTSRATPSPLRNVPSYALNGCDKERQRYMAMDSFARAATPPPDDEEIFQRQITPPPDDDDDICDSNPWLSPKEPSDPPPPAPKGQPISQLPPPGLDVHADAASFRSVTEGLEVGKDLPMYQYCAELKRKVTENRVVMVDAATGSGKSTLVPLCLAQQCLEEGRSCRIVVTQPRRMAAKKLAERVSKQVDRDVGTLIGYRVGGQDKRDHPQGLVVYVTVGHFLEALVHNPAHLENFSHVVLDEVHERFVEADFLMALLRMLLSRPESVKTRIVVMSATLQKALHLFFKPVLLPAPHRAEMTSITSPGSTPFKVEDFFLEDLPLHIRQKGPSFGELLPENLKTLKKSTTRSDKLTSACQKLTAVGAKWIKHLYEVMDIQVVLAFLPGLDQMKELKNHLTSMVEPAMQPTTEKPLKPDIILMHSALDDNDYKHAGDPVPPGQWKVIIATNMAESSLTLPSVGAVLDFGMHRVNEYNDESKMSTLVTSWCSKASLKQRRGRTGRTNDGKYYCMMERRVYEQLEDYDQSGVERSSLTKVALEAAYLADVLSREPQIRAGLPATVPARETVGRIVDFFDGDVGLWRIRAAEAQGECEWAAEEDLRLSQLHLDDVLKLLPSPPKTARIQTAITDLQEFGTLTVGERPTALGIACLKLPAEVHLARLVVLGWSMNMGPSACVLAAALSLTPSCDVFLTPMNTQGDLDGNSLYLLQQSISARSEYDGGWLSEPLTIYALCEKWLKNGGGLGQVPKIEEWRFVHQRLWSQFSAKVVDLWRAMQRLVPREDSRSYHDLRALQDLARGSPWGSFQPHRVEHLLEQDKEKLLALLTWGLAPGSFLAIGQSPSIYGKGSYGEFWKKAEKLDWDVADCLYWKRSQSDVEYTLNCLRNSNGTIRHVESAHIKEVTHEDVTDEKSKKACIVHLRKGQNDSRETKSEFELLYRLCSPFNGKATIGNLKIVSPVHPCALNWYMPYRNCEGLKEVCLNWKSPAYSLLNTTRRWPDRCRPKRFLVASGGDYRTDYHGDTKTRVTMLRGTSVLPSRDGGRQALLWCLAAGVPRDAQMTALCAPCKAPKAPKVPGAPEPPETPETPGNTLNPEHFEVRGLWMWERTLRLPNNAIITSADLKVVNDFRQALKKMQSYQPHRLAGTWYAEDAAFRIDYLEDEDEALDGEDGFAGRHDILIISKLFAHCEAGCEDVRKLYPCPGGWSLPTDGKTIRLEELSDGLRYEGRVLKRKEELAILEQFNPKSLKALKEAADKLLEVAKKAPQSRSPWPGRLVPLWADTAMSPFDLTDIEKRLANFCSDLRERSDLWGFQSQEEDNNNCDMEDDDVYIDTSLEKINKGYMWTLAESETFDLDNCGYLQMPENSIALPTAAVCVMCEEQGKTFSKRQLANPIHNRLCQDCILEKTAALQGNAYIKAEKSILRPPTAAQTMPKLVPAAAAQLPKVCSVCKKLLDAKNSTSTQRTKPTNKRKCQACAVKPT